MDRITASLYSRRMERIPAVWVMGPGNRKLFGEEVLEAFEHPVDGVPRVEVDEVLPRCPPLAVVHGDELVHGSHGVGPWDDGVQARRHQTRELLRASHRARHSRGIYGWEFVAHCRSAVESGMHDALPSAGPVD